MGGEVRHNGGGGPLQRGGRSATIGAEVGHDGRAVGHDGGAASYDGGAGRPRWAGRRWVSTRSGGGGGGLCHRRPNKDVALAHSGMIVRGARKKRRATPGCPRGRKADTTSPVQRWELWKYIFVAFPVIERGLSGASIHAMSCGLDLTFCAL